MLNPKDTKLPHIQTIDGASIIISNLKLKAGVDLIQIYTGFVYEGPGLLRK